MLHGLGCRALGTVPIFVPLHGHYRRAIGPSQIQDGKRKPYRIDKIGRAGDERSEGEGEHARGGFREAGAR
ncbi:hypothetical protein Aple_103480 [Acrocarpospora pleiomorpha]|uniref:Uncharacterized protein n=1 Tax=Acrocarpospora pleiomorpha TaxID=90975 RepID=A0A5M3Y6Z8_9ACTN|nr:hypothetical protein Aple_103480 [Acrocarpospora pleiomorpha]